MTNHETHQYEMLTRVKTFGDEHGERVARSPLARAQFAIIETAVTRLTNHAVAKLAAARVTGAAKRAARLALVDALSAIARTARAMGPALTGMRETFRMPSPRPDQALIIAGRLVAREAEALAAQFVTLGLPATFIADLRQRTERFEDVLREWETEKGDLAAARDQISAELTLAMTAVRTLDTIVANELREEPLTLEKWRRGRHVRSGRRTRAAASAESTAVLPATVPTPSTSSPAAGTV